MEQLTELYFELGIKHADIVKLLNDKHGYSIRWKKILNASLKWEGFLKESVTTEPLRTELLRGHGMLLLNSFARERKTIQKIYIFSHLDLLRAPYYNNRLLQRN